MFHPDADPRPEGRGNTLTHTGSSILESLRKTSSAKPQHRALIN